MRRFLVEAVVDAVIALGIILLLSLISVAQPFPFGTSSAPILALRGAGVVGFITWAAVLVLVNRFARPVIVALTGRVLLRTMGAFLVIINALALWITSLIAPIKIATVAEPFSLWLVVAAALYTSCRRSSMPSSGSTARRSRRRASARSGGSSSRCRPRAGTCSSRTSASSRSTT